MTATILIVDDEADIRALIKGILEDEGYKIIEASNSSQAYERLENGGPDLVIQDIWLENSSDDGIKILKTIKANDDNNLPVIMISGHGTIETAVDAIKHGAYDFIEKPFKTDRLLLMIERALETAQLRRENKVLRQKTSHETTLVGSSTPMKNLRQMIGRVARTNSRILLSGEPGTGKDLVARLIHAESDRASGPYMALNCAVLRPDRLEIELFGTVEGATDEPGKTGLLEQAHTGTLFLDQVADMPLETQGKILRVLQDQQFVRVGGRERITVDVRIISSSNRDLKTLTEEGKFREDLYYRLNVVPLEIPPLRERLQDIDELADYFAGLYSEQAGLPSRGFSKTALAAMKAYGWPGNVRQFRNVVEWLMIMSGGDAASDIEVDNLPPEITQMGSNGDAFSDSEEQTVSTSLLAQPLREAREQFEREYLSFQIDRFDGNVSRTAEFVEMERSALHRKLKQLKLHENAKKDKAGEAAAEDLRMA